ncbi:MAG: Glu-tRNA(Gln) amidotransferase subunit GatD [Candidatus Micrarchaeota archaeon]|nr:Glu-tRNA(Gln) amidotransferase subunit GatD [Candidatus Micrarchaeota archaeon]
MYSKKITAALEKQKISPGDRVRVEKAKETFEGILIPKPEASGDPEDVVVKLDSGYNVGIRFDAAVKISRLGKGAELGKFPSLSFKQKAGLPEVALIATGGTIAARLDYQTGGVTWLMEPSNLFALAPELSQIARFKVQKPFLIASENMCGKHWMKMAEAVGKEINSGVDGVMVTHGTDFLHFSSAALSFMLGKIPVPVAFTYAQRSSDRGSCDSPMNLVCAAHFAAKADAAEVVLVGHAESSDSYCFALRGTKVRKMHTSRRDAFRPINDSPLAKVWPDGRIELADGVRKRSKGRVSVDAVFEEKTALVKYHPGADPGLIDFFVDKKFRGIVVEAGALGHIATEDSEHNWLPSLKRAIEEGVVVCFAPQTLYGRLHPFVYDEARKVHALGVVYCEDMLPETAFVKLGFLLGHDLDNKQVRKKMTENLAGEINPRLTENQFLL